MTSRCQIAIRSAWLCLIATAAMLASTAGASAWTWKTLHSFCAWNNCNDGKWPTAGLLLGQNLIGSTDYGGKYNGGVVFKYDTSDAKYSVIHTFDSVYGCNNGSNNCGVSDLIADVDGNLYGTTFSGGTHGYGVIFRLAPTGNGWTYSVLHAFCGNCTGGGRPAAGLTYAGQSTGGPWDGSSPLFGTDTVGGAYGLGVAYKFAYTGSAWKETVIHDFKSGGPNPLALDATGNLFGTTQADGKYGYGLMFKLASGTWAETVLKNFCAQPNCADGREPHGRLLVDAAGDLFGTTYYGGANACGSVGCGTTFEYTSAGTYKVIYNFCSLANCGDGVWPLAGVVMDSSGDLVGTALAGGANGVGDVFELANRDEGWTETTLHSFCSKTGCPDGDNPYGPVILDGSGNVFGTAHLGGTHGDYGTIFKLTP